MGKLIYKIVAFIGIIIFISCQSKVEKNEITEVVHFGALKTIMSGNIEAVLDLDSLSNRKNIYALGAIENLKGEIQIFDSEPSNSFVTDSSLQIKDSYNLRSTLLVYAQVEEWQSHEINNISSKDDLERVIFETAQAEGINTDKPFPFLLEGKVAAIDWHVIDWKKGDTIHNHKKHKESGLNGTLKNKEVVILGFYSTKHKAIFTHHTTNMHMHFKTKDNSTAGHIDDLKLNNKITLKFTKK